MDSRTFNTEETKEGKSDLSSVFPKKNLLNKRFIRYGVIATTIILWLVILFSIFHSFEEKRQISTIYYNSKYTIFQTDIISIYIVLIILLCKEFYLFI